MSKSNSKKKLQISKRTIFLSIISVLVVAAPIVYYFLNRPDEGDVLSWYSSNWAYRRSITVGNTTGSTLTNEDVLVVIDTETLVSESKLQTDCGDLRFVDSDDTTILDYWIEGGCNTTTTEVWVRIPSLPNGGKTIYLYYANPSVANGGLSWSGNFIALSDQSSCPTGWSRVTAFDNRLPQGAASYGGTGGTTTHTHTYTSIPAHTHNPGTLATNSTGSHIHSIKYSQYPSGVGTYMSAQTTADQWSRTAVSYSGAHTHTITGSTSTTGVASGTTVSTDHLPPYVTMLFCSPDNSNISNIPQNTIFLFDSLPASGYSRYTSLDNRFPRGSSAPGTTGGAATHTHGYSSIISHSHGVGTLVTVSAGSHNHSLRYRSGVSGYSPYIDGNTTAGTSVSGSLNTTGAHTHTISGSVTTVGVASPETNSQDNLPPYLNMVFGISSSSLDSFSEGTISIFTVEPPLGWNRYSTLDSKFAIGASTQGGTGGTSTHTHVYTDVPSHTHTSGTFAAASAGSHTHNVTRSGGGGGYLPYPVMESNSYAWGGSTANMTSEGAHTHGFSGATASAGVSNPTTGSSNHLPSYIDVIYSKRKISQSTTVNSEEAYNQAPTTPTSLLTEGQTNPVNVTDTTPEFSAIYNDPDTTDTAEYYQIQVNTTNTFDGTTMWDSTKTSMTSTTESTRSPDISYAGTSLNYNTTYYWRIKFWDALDAESPWSSTATFKLNRTPTAPTSLLTEGQTNPTNVTDTTPEFSAIYNDPDTSDTSSYYEIEVNTTSGFTGTVMWDTDKTSMTTTNQGSRSPDISYAGTSLNYNTTYYWRIKFWDSVDQESPWSSTANFKLNRVPTSPTNLLTEGQTNPTTIKDTTPEFSAIFNDPDTDDTSSFYEIEVNTASNFTGTFMWDSTKTSMTTTNQGNRSPDITYAGSTLSIENTYYWRIKFWDSVDQESPWSSTASFKIDINPTATNLLIMGTQDPSTTYFDIYFSSIYTDPNSDNSSAYQIQVNTTSNFTGTTMWDSTKISTTISSGSRSSDIYYNGTTLNYDGTTYYVRMRFWDTDDNVSNWTTGQFTDTLKRFQLDGLQMNGIRLD